VLIMLVSRLVLQGMRRLVISGALLTPVVFLPAIGRAQTPEAVAARQSALRALRDSQWIRVVSVVHGRREARLLSHSATELVLDLEPQSLRIPATSIDSVWEKRTASKTGALAGALLGAGIGLVFATQANEEGETPSAEWVAGLGLGGAVAGGLLGAAVGRAFPRWYRRYPRGVAPPADGR
jgi:hypothetical protein